MLVKRTQQSWYKRVIHQEKFLLYIHYHSDNICYKMQWIYRDHEYYYLYNRLLDKATITTTLAISRLQILFLEVFKPIHLLNLKCISDLFKFKSTTYSMRNNEKVLQFGVESYCTNIEILDHPVSCSTPV